MDSSARLKRGDEIRTVTIVPPADAQPDNDEFAPTESIARALIGKRVGDLVVLKDTPLERIEYEVVSISNKYAATATAIFEQFTRRFPEHEGLTRITGTDEQLAQIVLSSVGSRSSHGQDVLSYYQKGLLTHGVAARALGLDEVSLWYSVTQSKYGLVASSGTPQDLQNSARALEAATGVCLDVSSLCTLVELGLAASVSKALNVSVAQSALDLLLERDADVKRGTAKDGRATLWMEDGIFHERRIAPAALQAEIDRTERLRSFIRNEAEVRAIPIALDLGPDELAQLRERLGRASASSALIARETGRVLVTDDLVVRVVAGQTQRIGAVSTAELLSHLLAAGYLTQDQYVSALTNLARWNYHHLSIRSEDLLFVIERAPGDAAAAITPLLASLHGPRSTFESAIAVSAEVLHAMWTAGHTDATRLAVTAAVVGALRVGRDSIVVLVALRSRLRNLFSPLVSFQFERPDQVITQLLASS